MAGELPVGPSFSKLTGTQLETETLRCAYSATEDGWNADAFHDRVDGYGAALCVARTQVRGCRSWCGFLEGTVCMLWAVLVTAASCAVCPALVRVLGCGNCARRLMDASLNLPGLGDGRCLDGSDAAYVKASA